LRRDRRGSRDLSMGRQMIEGAGSEANPEERRLGTLAHAARPAGPALLHVDRTKVPRSNGAPIL
jgi:hypothetical protein